MTEAQKDAILAALATGFNELTPEQEKMVVAYFTDVGKETADAATDLAAGAINGAFSFLADFFPRGDKEE